MLLEDGLLVRREATQIRRWSWVHNGFTVFILLLKEQLFCLLSFAFHFGREIVAVAEVASCDL